MCQFKHTPEPSFLHHLTSTTLTFDSNHSSPLARPCLTKDNLHRSAPAPCLLSSAITVVPKNHRLPFFPLFLGIVPPLTYKYLQQCCMSVNRCVYAPFFTSRQNWKRKKRRENSHGLIGIAFFCHQEQMEVIDALCVQISVLCKTKQYITIWNKLWMFCKGPHYIYVSFVFSFFFFFSFTCVEVFPLFFCSVI